MDGAPQLTGKRILVTGGSRGLGQAICARFAAAGARVAFTYARNDQAAAATLATLQHIALQAAGCECESHRLSVLDGEGSARLARDLEQRWGGVDILVNNAGVSQVLPLALMDEEDWDHVMDTNVKGAFLTSRAVLPGMIRRRSGVILNIGSLAGSRMLAAPVHYCASKAAVQGLTQAMAKEVARYQIRVLCLAPGLLADGMGRNLPEHELADYLSHCSLGRLGTLEEVAEFAAFLVSDANSYMSGATIVMDGGI